MTESLGNSGFEKIYSTELVYVPDCWKLCGDAHCCSFSRYKSQFKMIAQTPFQELPLLPGEYQFLKSRDWLQQFGDHDHKIVEFEIDGSQLFVESIISRRPNCACDHDTRPTICRLYPLLPVFDLDGRVVGTDVVGIYEEMERIAGLEKACQLNALPFEQLNKFLSIADEIGKNPLHLFYLRAYEITKRHVSNRLADKHNTQQGNIFTAFESSFIRRALIDTNLLRQELNDLANRFHQRYGDRFDLAGYEPYRTEETSQ